MLRFPQEFIDKVREASNLVDIIQQHTDLKGRGHQFMGLCPFPDHTESTPSFSVSEDRQLYHCFGCKKSGNVFTFLQDFMGLSFPQAVEHLAKRYSIELPQVEGGDPRWQERKSDREANLGLNKAAAIFFHETLMRLPRDGRVWGYLASRNLSEDMVKTFRLGYAPEEWSSLAEFLSGRRHSLDRAEELGLVRRRRSGSGHFDFFRDRIMFPILSQTREVLGFGGRSLTPDNEPKYRNSPETPVFHKGQTVYGIQESARHIRADRKLVVVEGYMDLLALWRAGIKNVVATLGTALTPEHAQLFKRFGDDVILLFDGDSAGQAAAERSMAVLLEADLLPKVVLLPERLDPEDYLNQYGDAALKEKILKASDLFESVVQMWMEGFRATPAEKLQIVERAKQVWPRIQRESLRSLYASTLSRHLGESSEWVLRALRESDGRPQKVAPRTEKSTGVREKLPEMAPSGVLGGEGEFFAISGAPKEEVLALSLALKSTRLLEIAQDIQLLNMLAHPGVKSAMEWVLEKSRQKPDMFDKLGALLASKIDTPSAIMAYAQYSQGELSESGELQLMKDCCSRIQSRYLRNQARQLAHQMQDRPEREKLEQIMNIHKDRLSLKEN